MCYKRASDERKSVFGTEEVFSSNGASFVCMQLGESVMRVGDGDIKLKKIRIMLVFNIFRILFLYMFVANIKQLFIYF